MSNEELVAAIQAGSTERVGELWEQVSGLAKWKASRIMTVLDLRGNPCGVEFEDLYQSGYLAMVVAAGSYKPESGAFSTWFMYHLKKAFAEATGYRTKAGQNEPLNTAFSLDKPLTDEANSDTFGDLIPDAKGPAALEAVEEREFQRQLHEALEAALAELPQQSAEVLRLRHFQGLTLADIGNIRGVTAEQIRQIENKALRRLREPGIARRLRPFYDFDFYGGTGLSAFRHSGMSIQERYLVKDEKRRKAEERIRREVEQIRQEAEERVSRMTREEKGRLLKRYGLQ